MKSLWEGFWLFAVFVSLVVAVALPLHPDAQWPEWALLTGGAALAGIISIVGFFWSWLRARDSWKD